MWLVRAVRFVGWLAVLAIAQAARETVKRAGRKQAAGSHVPESPGRYRGPQ